MIPYEAALLVLAFAVMSTCNALFRETRWLSFVCLCLAIFGITGLVEPTVVYRAFFYFGPTSVIVFLIAALFSGLIQRVLLALLAGGILLGSIYAETVATGFYDKAIVYLVLFGISAIVPALVGYVTRTDETRVEKILSAQQAWMRLVFLEWCRVNFTNVHHYDFFDLAIPALTIGAALTIVFRIGASRETWFFGARSFLSLAILAGGLALPESEVRFLVLWSLLLFLVDVSPDFRGGQSYGLSRRLGLGAFGGLAFWGLIFLLDHSPMDVAWKSAWIAMIFVLGGLALLMPDGAVGDEEKNQWLPALRYLPHALFLTFVLYWPQLRNLGG